jgi:uncharacterized protein (DUF2062 family)
VHTLRRWFRALAERFHILLTEESSPGRLALAFGVGAACGPPPIFFLHLAAAASLAWLLRLNKVVAVVGCNVVNPWTAVFFLYLDVQAGAWLLGRRPPPWPDHLGLAELKQWIEPYILMAFVGSIPVAVATGLVSGTVVYVIARIVKQRRDASPASS